MKHTGENLNDSSVGSDLRRVCFKFSDPAAATVSIAGTFNNWHPTTRLMQFLGNGHWLKEAYLPPGNYEYCLVVDGRWIPDPLAKGDVPNPFGGRNSLLEVQTVTEDRLALS